MRRDRLDEILSTGGLAEAREAVGITQQALADRSGLSRSYVAMIEAAEREYPADRHESILEALVEWCVEREQRREQIREIVERLNPWTEADAERLALERRLAELRLTEGR